jgi:large subunit ribosomal protein L23
MIIQKPVFSEKSWKEYQRGKICVFYVAPSANKFQIKKSFEEMFRVKVKKVRTSRKKPVSQKTSSLRRLPGKNSTKLQKKAFVELMPNQELPLFSER